MLAVGVLLADPEALADDILELCLYLLREKLRAASDQGGREYGKTTRTPATRATDNQATLGHASPGPCDET
jgi:hypothetical protein